MIDVTSYRGFEVPFEYLWMLADDFLAYYGESESTLYICRDPEKFTAPGDSATEAPDGYTPEISLPRSGSYGWNEGITTDGFSAVSSHGGSENTGTTDYFWNTATVGWWGALLGAAAHCGAGAGFGYLLANDRSSGADADIGFRLCRGGNATTAKHGGRWLF